MGAADMMLLALLVLGNACLMTHRFRRRARDAKIRRMLRSLQAAIRREIGAEAIRVAEAPTPLAL